MDPMIQKVIDDLTEAEKDDAAKLVIEGMDILEKCGGSLDKWFESLAEQAVSDIPNPTQQKMFKQLTKVIIGQSIIGLLALTEINK